MTLQIEEAFLSDCKTQRGEEMISLYKFDKIRTLHAAGKSQRAIAKKLKVGRRTVKAYIESNSPPAYKERSQPKPTLVEIIQPYVNEILAKNNKNSRDEVLCLLRKRGVEVSSGTVARAMAFYRTALPKERFFDQEYQPGEQAQVDFKESLSIPFAEGPVTANLLFLTFPFSDAVTAVAFPEKTFSCFMEGVHQGFEELGGMTQNLRFDNLSPCVTKVGKGSNRTYTAAFAAATEHYGFGLLPCSPGKGSDKGDVERDIRTYTRRIENAIINDDLVFSSWDDFNAWLRIFFRTQRTIRIEEKLQLERSNLRAVPARNESIICRILHANVGKSGIINVNKRALSVPDAYIGQDCDVIFGPFAIEIRPHSRALASAFHPPVKEGGESISLEHVLTSLTRKPGAMMRWAYRDVLFPAPVCKKYHAALQKRNSATADRDYLRSVNLVLNSSWKDVQAGMELTLDLENPVAELELLFTSTQRRATHIDPPALVTNLALYDEFIPNYKGESDGLSAVTRGIEESASQPDGRPFGGNRESCQRKETDLRTVSITACSGGIESAA